MWAHRVGEAGLPAEQRRRVRMHALRQPQGYHLGALHRERAMCCAQREQRHVGRREVVREEREEVAHDSSEHAFVAARVEHREGQAGRPPRLAAVHGGEGGELFEGSDLHAVMH